MAKLVEQKKVTSKDGREMTLSFFTEEVIDALLKSLEDSKTNWLNTTDKRFSVGFSFSNASTAKDKDGNIIGLYVYPYIVQSFFSDKDKKRVTTNIKDYTEVKIKQAIENFNKAFENIAHAGLSSKQIDKNGKPYEGRRCYLVVHFNMKNMLQDLKANNVDVTKDYSIEEAVAVLTPVFSTYLDDVKNKVKEFTSYIDKATELKKQSTQFKQHAENKEQTVRQEAQKEEKDADVEEVTVEDTTHKPADPFKSKTFKNKEEER